MDLGATRFTTFRLVTLPNLGSALLAGGLLAFALSFDEIVVTTFTAPPDIQTLPLWIYTNLLSRQQAPIVNVAAAGLILLSVIPIYLLAEAVRRPDRWPPLSLGRHLGQDVPCTQRGGECVGRGHEMRCGCERSASEIQRPRASLAGESV